MRVTWQKENSGRVPTPNQDAAYCWYICQDIPAVNIWREERISQHSSPVWRNWQREGLITPRLQVRVLLRAPRIAKEQYAMPNKVDLTGQRFGMLTATHVSREHGPGVIWHCVCDCGNEIDVPAYILRAGGRKTCGHHKQSRYKDITGMKFGLLTALRHIGTSDKGRSLWECSCDCGNTTQVDYCSLTSGNTKSCGCLHPAVCRTHGMSQSRLYIVFKSMHNRCERTSNKAYKYYGARGIKVCDEWSQFEPFYDWAMQAGYDPDAPRGKCTIDRIDVNGDYCPDNCRWVDMHTQAMNKRTHKEDCELREKVE